MRRPGAVEEVLRYDSSVSHWRRRTTRPVELSGVELPADADVLVSIGAANRDPEVFAEPDTFDVSRTNNRHLAFGAGPHVCIGAGLARRELEIGLLALIRRMPNLHLIEGEEPSRRRESLVFRGFHRLPVAIS